jgi:hypothetical protein
MSEAEIKKARRPLARHFPDMAGKIAGRLLDLDGCFVVIRIVAERELRDLRQIEV